MWASVLDTPWNAEIASYKYQKLFKGKTFNLTKHLKKIRSTQ